MYLVIPSADLCFQSIIPSDGKLREPPFDRDANTHADH